MLIDQLRDIAPFKRPLACEDLIQHQPQRIHVGLRSRRRTVELLRSHVRRRAGLFVASEFIDKAGKSEVRNTHPSPSIQHDIGRFEIAMHDSHLVSRRQARTNLAGEFHAFLGGQVADPSEQCCQVLTVDVLHGNEMEDAGANRDLADVMDATDVRMRDLACRANFTVKSRDHRSIAGKNFRKEFQRRQLVKFEVFCFVDLSHTPSPQ